MPSKKVTISQKIFIFLLLTVGIVFILLQVYRSVREGFQSTDDIACERKEINGRKIFLCDTRDAALSQLINMRDDSFADVGVCYADIQYDSNIAGYSNFNFGIGASNLPTKFYTCFNRPPGLEFDTTNGTKIPISEFDDLQPESGVNILKTNCAAYNGAFQTYFNSYIKTSSILGSVNTIGFSNISSGIGILSTISTQKCVSSDDSTTTPSNPKGIYNTNSNVCITIRDGISRFVSISNDTSPNSLSSLKSVLIESKNVLSNQMYTILKPAFLNSGCIADADMSNYMRII